MRSSEWLLVAYFFYVSVLSFIFPVRAGTHGLLLGINLAIIGSYVVLVLAESKWPIKAVSITRDWYALALMLPAYQEMGWFAPAQHTFELERTWVVWDRLLLREWGLRRFIELLGPLLPALLEISYSLVYTLAPFSVAMLYVYHRRKRVDRLLFLFMLGVLLAYTQFPFWPSEPPRTVFPGEDFPSYETVFRRFNWWLLGGYGIHTSVFPSAHVSGAFSLAFGMMRVLPERRWVGRFLLVMAVLIATVTVYGRYHYAADAVAGFAISLAALGITALTERISGARA